MFCISQAYLEARPTLRQLRKLLFMVFILKNGYLRPYCISFPLFRLHFQKPVSYLFISLIGPIWHIRPISKAKTKLSSSILLTFCHIYLPLTPLVFAFFSNTRVPSHKYSNYEPLLLKISYTISIGRHQKWGRGGAKMRLGPTTLLIMSVLLVCCNHCSTQKAVRC
mgnify:CR=1 FL=1